MNKFKDILLIIHTFCRYLPHLAIISSIFAIVVIYQIFGITLLFGALTILIPLILVSILLMFNPDILKNNNILLQNLNIDIPLSQSALIKVYFITLAITLICLHIGSRDLIFLINIFLMYAIILAQIFSKKFTCNYLILAELFITTSVLTLTKQLCYSYFYGGSDIIWHSGIVSLLLDSGSLSEISSMNIGYAHFTLYHIGIAITSLLTNLPVHISTSITMVPGVLITVLFVYYIALYFTKSEKIAIIAAFYYSIMPMILDNVAYPMPRFMATLGFFVVLYSMLKTLNSSTSKCSSVHLAYLIIIIIETSYMTIVHHMQLPILFMFMSIFWIFYWLYFGRTFNKITPSLIIFYFLPIAYWLYTFFIKGFGIMYRKINFTIGDSAPSMQRFGGDYSNIDIIANIFPFISSSIMIILAMAGLYYILSPININKKIIIMSIPMLLLLPIFLPGIVDISPVFEDILSISRFRPPMSLFFAVIMSVGGIVIVNCLNNYTKKESKLPNMLFFSICLLFVVLSPILTFSTDSNIFSGTKFEEHSYLNDTDMSTIDVIDKYIPDNQAIFVDSPITRFFEIKSFKDTSSDMYDLFYGNISENQYPYIIFRHELYKSYQLKVTSQQASERSTRIKYNTDAYNKFMSNTQYYTHFYENGKSSIYYYE